MQLDNFLYSIRLYMTMQVCVDLSLVFIQISFPHADTEHEKSVVGIKFTSITHFSPIFQSAFDVNALLSI